MITNNIDFDVIEQKTSEKFVKMIKRSVDLVNTSDVWEDKEIQFYIEEDKYSLTVLMCFGGNLSRYEYRYSIGDVYFDSISWSDIRMFFDIPLRMKKIEKAV